MKWFYKKIIKWWNDQCLILNNFHFNNIFVRCSEGCIFPHLNYEMILQKIIKWWNDQFLILNNFHYNNIFVRQSEVCLFLNLRLQCWNTHTHTHTHTHTYTIQTSHSPRSDLTSPNNTHQLDSWFGCHQKIRNYKL